MKKAAILFFISFLLLFSCKKNIPDPPLTAQVNGVPTGTGPCTISFYSTIPNRTYTLVVDGTYQGTLSGATNNPSCGGQGTATFNLSMGSHTVAVSWIQGSTNGSSAFSFSLTSTNCVLYAL